jgi:hypothetical protein
MKFLNTIITLLFYIIKKIQAFDYVKTQSVIQVSQVTAYDESDTQGAYLSNGNLVIIWLGSTAQQAYNVYFNLYDQSGKLLTANPVIVNNPTTYSLNWPFVVADKNGGFVIAWELNNTPSFNYIYVRYYDATMTPGNIIQVNNPVGQQSNGAMPAIDLLSNGNYIIVWNISYNYYCVYAQILDPKLNLVGNNFPAPNNPDCSYVDVYVSALVNGFVISWTNNTKYVAKIFDLNGTGISQFVVENVASAYPGSAQLKNGNFILVWKENSANMIYSQIYDKDGNIVKAKTQVNTTISGTQKYSFVTALSFGGFAISWVNASTSLNRAFLQIFDENGNKIGVEKLANTNTQFEIDEPMITENQKDGSLLVAWYSMYQIKGYDAWAQFFYKDLGQCSGVTIPLDKQKTSISIVFPSLKSSTVFIRTLPKTGSLTDTNGQPIVLSQQYSKDSLVYKYTTPSDDSFIFNTNLIDTPCIFKLTLSICYQSCSTCHGPGDATNNNCSQCASDYYPLYDNKAICYLKTDTIQGYIFSSSYNMFITSTCYKSCSTCITQGNDTQHNCLLCKPNYFILEDNKSNCYMSSEIVPGYMFSQSDSIFHRCYLSCATCSAIGNNVDNKCLTCATSFYPIVDNNTMCYTSDSKMAGYYLDTQDKMFKHCSKACLTCSASGDDINTNCDKCANNFYPLVDNGSVCLTSNATRDGYYFSFQDAMFNKCFDSCNTCIKAGDFINNYCQTCSYGYYPLSDIGSNCFKSDSKIAGYYFEPSINIFKKCYSTCRYCTGPGVASNPNCTECAVGFDTCDGCSNYVYKDNCVDQCPALTYTSNKICIDCNQGEVVYNNQCVKECPFSLISDSYTCIDCKGNNMIKYNNQCVEACPSNTAYDADNNLCYSCKDRSLLFYKSACVATCPDGTINTDSVCKSCTDVNRSFYNGSCVDKCPDGYISDKGICVDKNTFYSGNYEVCQSDTCLNGGTCSIKSGRVSCSCTLGFTGQYCQLANTSDELTRYISIILLNF